MTKTPPKLALFFDTETTGLDPESLHVLEVGAVLVEWAHTSGNDGDLLPVLGEFREVVRPTARPSDGSIALQPMSDEELGKLIAECPEFVRDMHEETGLWNDVYEAKLDLADVEEKLCFWLKTLTDGEVVALGGSGISHFDRPAVIDRQMPRLAEQLYYWDLDAGVVRRFFERAGSAPVVPEEWEGEALTFHRALDDARHSVLQARAFLSRLGA